MKFQVLMTVYNLDSTEAFHDTFTVDLKEGDYQKGETIGDQECHVEKLIRKRVPKWKAWIMEFTIWLDRHDIGLIKFDTQYRRNHDAEPYTRDGFLELLLKGAKA